MPHISTEVRQHGSYILPLVHPLVQTMRRKRVPEVIKSGRMLTGYFDACYSSAAGNILMTGCLSLYLFAYFLSCRLVEVEV